MARSFSPLSLAVPLRTTWEESWQLLQAAGGPALDLTGYEARMFLLEVEDGEPVVGALPVTYTTTGLLPKLDITPLTGQIDLKVSAVDVKLLSTGNVGKVFAYEVELYIPIGVNPEYVVPLFKGFATVKARVVLL